MANKTVMHTRLLYEQIYHLSQRSN